MENRAIANSTRFEIYASGAADIDISPPRAFSLLEYLTTNGGYSRLIHSFEGIW